MDKFIFIVAHFTFIGLHAKLKKITTNIHTRLNNFNMHETFYLFYANERRSSFFHNDVNLRLSPVSMCFEIRGLFY